MCVLPVVSSSQWPFLITQVTNLITAWNTVCSLSLIYLEGMPVYEAYSVPRYYEGYYILLVPEVLHSAQTLTGLH